MNLSHAYGTPPSAEVGERVLLEALDAGVTMFDTAALYGFGVNEQLVGRVLKPHRDRIVLASKGGMAGVDVAGDGKLVRVINGRPEVIRQNCEDSLRRLGTEVIDLYYLHRWDKKVPIEDSVGELSRLVERGWVRSIGLSEVSAATIRRARAVHPLAAVQSEYSLWTRNPELGALQACDELKIAFVAFSPLGRGFFGGELQDTRNLLAGDVRRAMPRFEPEAYAANLRLLSQHSALAKRLGCTPAQLALAWLLHKSPTIIPLFGTTRVEHLHENLGADRLALSPECLDELEQLINERTVVGERYSAQSSMEVDAESFATPGAKTAGTKT
jgi:aryl-alcohol dehydrogenase-like predicted oxidoreductase